MCIRVAGQAIHLGLLTIFLVLIGKLKKKPNFFYFKGEIRPRTLNGPLGLNFYIEIYS